MCTNETQSERSELERRFCENLNRIMEIEDISQADLARCVGVTTAATAQWSTGLRVPRMNTIEQIANCLNVKVSALFTEQIEEEYYYNDRTKAIARDAHNHPHLAVMFDAIRDVDPEDLDAVHQLLKRMKKHERHENYDGIDESDPDR